MIMHFLPAANLGLHSQAGMLIAACLISFAVFAVWDLRRYYLPLLHRQRWIRLGECLPEEEIYSFDTAWDDDAHNGDYTQQPC